MFGRKLREGWDSDGTPHVWVEAWKLDYEQALQLADELRLWARWHVPNELEK